MSLPRELHLWLQSLDLTYPIKHPKRDFANGFLIAEIISRYLPPSDLDIHQYRTGLSTEQKLSNWSALERVVARQGWDVTRAEMDALMHSQPDSHLRFLSHLYSILTHKKLQPITQRPAITSSSHSAVPIFLAPTASTAVKARLNEADVVGGLGEALDDSGMTAALEKTLEQHSEEMRAEKRRHASAIRRHMAQQRMINRQLAAATSAPSTETSPPIVEPCAVKTVTVRQIETPSLSALSALTANSAASRPVPARSSLSALNAVVVNSPAYIYQQLDQPYAEFVSALTSLPDETIAAVLDGIVVDALDVLVVNAIASPKDFYVSLGLVWQVVVAVGVDGASWQSALTVLTQWGERLRRRDDGLSASLCDDYLLPKLLPLLSTQPGKQHHLVPLLYAFHPDSPQQHAAVLSSLPNLIPSTRTLLLCLSSLLQLDTNELTIAACRPHIDRNIQHENPLERALAISLLAPIAASPHSSSVKPYWAQLEAALGNRSSDDSWCVAVEALHVLLCLLSSSSSEAWMASDKVYELVEQALSSSPSFAVTVSCIPHLAPHIGAHPRLRALLFSLLSSSAPVRQYCLASIVPPSVPASVSSLFPLFTPDLRATYSPLLLLRSLIDTLRASRASSLSDPQVELIAAAVSDSVDTSGALVTEGWEDVLPPLLPLLLSCLHSHTAYVLSVLTVALVSGETRGQALALFRSSSSPFLLLAGRVLEQDNEASQQSDRSGREELLEWLWEWVERRGQDAVMREILRRLLVGWSERLGQDKFEAAGLASLLLQLQGEEHSRDGRADKVDEEEKQQRSPRDVHFVDGV